MHIRNILFIIVSCSYQQDLALYILIPWALFFYFYFFNVLVVGILFYNRVSLVAKPCFFDKYSLFSILGSRPDFLKVRSSNLRFWTLSIWILYLRFLNGVNTPDTFHGNTCITSANVTLNKQGALPLKRSPANTQRGDNVVLG